MSTEAKEKSKPVKIKLRMTDETKDVTARAVCELIAEVMFVLVPFIVTGIVFSYKGDNARLFQTSEWSLAASVFFGQAAVKLITGIVGGGRRALVFNYEPVVLIFASIIVLGLIPSLLVLTLVLIAEQPTRSLSIAQYILFGMGLVVFIVFGLIGKLLSSEEIQRVRERRKAAAVPPTQHPT